MAINRRTFLEGAVLGGAWMSFPFKAHAADNGYIVGTSRLSETQYAVSKVDLSGRLQWQADLPTRGHATIIHETTRTALVIARRPGTYLMFVDLANGDVQQQIELPASLKLNGHAVWTDDQTVVISAAERETSRMVLLTLKRSPDSLTYQWVDQKTFEWSGPHELILHKGSAWVAIGGLKTDGRDVLNRDSLISGLLQLNAQSLEPVQFIESPVQGVSLRHMDADGDTLAIAGQFQQWPNTSPALLFALRDNQLQPFDVPDTLWTQLKGYVGTLKVTDDAIVATSPRAHWVGLFDKNTLALNTQRLSSDVCAIAKTPDGILVGSGTGKMMTLQSSVNSKVIWDNHFAYSAV